MGFDVIISFFYYDLDMVLFAQPLAQSPPEQTLEELQQANLRK